MKTIQITLFIIFSLLKLDAQVPTKPMTSDPLSRYQKYQIPLSEELKKDIVIAVFDTGIDLEHPDLVGNIARNEIECDEGNAPTPPFTDRDQNGFPGDCMGWNFIPNEAAADARPEEMTTHELPQLPNDVEGHGTHVSGIIGAVSNNKIGLSNSSNRIKILPIKVFPKSTQSRNTFRIMVNKQMLNSNRTSILIQAFDYAMKRGVDVINLSIGWNKNLETPELRQKINQAIAKGIIIVAAAGNDASEVTTFPCLYQNVICVGASNDQYIAKISNYGNGVDFLAPGEEILSTFPLNQIFVQFLNGYAYYSGTSQAAPYLAKLIALLKGLNPNITHEEILARLHYSSKKFGSLNHHLETPYLLSGIVDAQVAIEATSKEINQATIFAPSFKNLNQLVLHEENKTTLIIPLSFFAAPETPIEAKLEPLSKSIDVNSATLELISSKQFNQVELKFDIQINDLSINQKQTFYLHLKNTLTQKIQTYKFNTKFYLSKVLPKTSFNFDYVTTQPYFSTRGQDKGTALKNIQTLYEEKTNYFYVEFFSKKDDVVSSRLTLHKLTENSFQEVASTTSNDVVLSYGLKKVDLNNDEIPEFIYTTEAIDKETKKRFVKIFYLNHELKPVYADIPFFRYDLIFPLYMNDQRHPLYPLGNINIIPITVDGKILPQIMVFHDFAILENYQTLKKYFPISNPAGIGADIFFFNPEWKEQKWTYKVAALSSELLQAKWSSLIPNSNDGKIKAFNSLCKNCYELQFAVVYAKGKLEKLKFYGNNNLGNSNSIFDLSSYAKKFDSTYQKYLAVNVYSNNKVHIIDLTQNKSWWAQIQHQGPWRVLKINSTQDAGARVLLTDGSQLVQIQANQAGNTNVSNIIFGKYFGTQFSSISELFDMAPNSENIQIQLLGHKISDIGLSFVDLSGDTLALKISDSFIQNSNCLSLGNFWISPKNNSNFIQLCQEAPNKLRVEIY
jgi:hypothetical protein